MSDFFVIILLLILCLTPFIYQLIIAIKESKKGNNISLKKFFKISKYSFFIFMLLGIGIGVISHTNYFNYEKPLGYDKYDEITFNNFRGIEFFKKSLYGSKRFAYVVTSIESEIDGSVITVESLFHPSRSYVYNTHTNSKELLNHEKYHIKITELYSRKAKKRISELDRFSSENINKILKRVRKEERVFQKSYDYDTFHSYVLGEQKKYEKQIDSLLNLLKDFKNPKIKIHDKN